MFSNSQNITSKTTKKSAETLCLFSLKHLCEKWKRTLYRQRLYRRKVRKGTYGGHDDAIFLNIRLGVLKFQTKHASQHHNSKNALLIKGNFHKDHDDKKKKAHTISMLFRYISLWLFSNPNLISTTVYNSKHALLIVNDQKKNFLIHQTLHNIYRRASTDT